LKRRNLHKIHIIILVVVIIYYDVSLLDVVYVGTIHPYHAEVSKLILNAGKSVLCEKPMAMNVKEATEVLNLAKEKKVFYMEVECLLLSMIM